MKEVVDKDKYSNPKYSIPYSSEVPKSEGKYYLAWFEAIYAYWLQGKTGISWVDTEKFRFLRKYGEGKQSEDLYKSILQGIPRTANQPTVREAETDVDTYSSGSKEAKQRGYANLLYDIVSPADKLLSALIGKLSKINMEISVDAIDETSKNEEERRKFETLLYMDNKDFVDQFKYVAGIPPDNPEFMPQSKDELDIFGEEGGFKLPYALGMESFTHVTEEISSWDEIRDDMFADMINIKVTGMIPYFDEGSKRIMWKYADPEKTVIQHSDYADHRDSEYGGQFDFVPVSTLIQEGVVSTQDEIKDLLNKYSGKYNNPIYSELRGNEGLGNTPDHLLDSFKVLIFRGWWVDNDIKKDLIHTKKNGETRLRNYKPNKKPGSTETVRETKQRKLYTGNWVVGTEYKYGCGLFKDIISKNRNDVNFPQFMIKAKGRSTTEQVYPFYDALQLNWLKYQDAIATAKKAGYVIDYNAIANLKIGGKKNDEKETIRRLMQTGVIIVKATNVTGRQNVFQKPVYELSGGVGKQLEEFITSFEFITRMIENFTGINPITLGSIPDKDALVGTTEISVAGTDNILQVIINAVSRVQQKAHDYCIDWLQLLIKHNPEVAKVYEEIIGREAMSAIKSANKDNVSYGVFITPGLSDFEKGKLLQSAEISLQNGRDGKPGINEGDYAYILRMMKSKKSAKMIHLVLDQRIKRAVNDARKNAQETMLADRQATGEIEKAKSDREFEMKKKEHEWKLEEIEAEGVESRKTITLEHDLEPKKEPEIVE